MHRSGPDVSAPAFAHSLRRAAAYACVALVFAAAPLRADDPTKDPAGPGAPATPPAPAAPADETLADDPSLVTGTLPNGVRYVAKRHGTPAGRVCAWLHVGVGSLVEEEDERGIAHYLEHMAFNGSEHFPPGSVVPYFESLGLTFGRDQNAFTTQQETTYQLALPEASPETLSKALLFLSDVAFRLTLSPEEIDAERQIILEEKRARSGAQQRVREAVIAALLPASRLATRMPIGTDVTVRTLRPEAFRAFYARWYVPGNMTVLVAGDVDPAVAVKLVTTHFGGAAAAKEPPRPDPLGPVRAAVRGVVTTDAEQAGTRVSLVAAAPSPPPTTTVAGVRRELAERLGIDALQRRFAEDRDAGTGGNRRPRVSLGSIAGAVQLAGVESNARGSDWRTPLGELAAAVQQVRRHGFHDREIGDARAALLASAERAADAEAATASRDLLRALDAAVTAREPLLSAAQRLDLVRRLLPEITAGEVTAAFARTFDADRMCAVLETRPGAAVPTADDLAAAARAALAAETEDRPEKARPTGFLAKLPEPGTVVEPEEDAASEVFSAWLGNGVRVHHRRSDARAGEATVTVTLAGGEIQEVAANRGITQAAATAWARNSVRSLDAGAAREFLVGKKVRVASRAGRDALTLAVSGSVDDLETGMQLGYLLLTEPLVTQDALRERRQAGRRGAGGRSRPPRAVLAQALAEAMAPEGEVRLRPVRPEETQRVTAEVAQAWIDTLVRTAPIEVSVVGDIDRDAALGLVRRYVGSLPARDRISAATFAPLRKIAPRPGPVVVRRTVNRQDPEAVVLVGCRGADASDVRETRLLAVAARILSTRMVRSVREEKQLVYSVSASSRTAVEYPSTGLFAAEAPTDPAKADALVAALVEVYDAFADKGPTGEEMTVALRQIDASLAEQSSLPAFWTDRLSALDYRGTDLRDVLGARAAYAAFEPEDVRDAFRRHWTPAGRVTAVVAPTAGAAQPAAPRAPTPPDADEGGDEGGDGDGDGGEGGDGGK